MIYNGIKVLGRSGAEVALRGRFLRKLFWIILVANLSFIGLNAQRGKIQTELCVIKYSIREIRKDSLLRMEVSILNKSSSNLLCSPRTWKYKKDPLGRFECDTIDFATYYIECYKCLEDSTINPDSPCRCLKYELTSSKKALYRFFIHFKIRKKPIVLRVFSIEEKYGYKFLLNLSSKSITYDRVRTTRYEE